jgi:hypothetical protein
MVVERAVKEAKPPSKEKLGGEIGPPHFVPSIEIEDFNLQEVQDHYNLNNLRSI